MGTNYLEQYIAKAPAAQDFFELSFLNSADRSKAVKRATQRNMMPALIDEIARQNALAPAEVQTNIEHLRQGNVAVVATGQQLGFLGGPLLTMYKILGAIKTAQALAEETGVVTVPVFWMQSEDHDFEEIREMGYYTADGSYSSVGYSGEPVGLGDSVGPIEINPDSVAVVENFLEEQHPTTREFWNDLCAGYLKGESLSAAFGHYLRSVFGSYGLVVFDPNVQVVKELYKDFIASSIVRSGGIGRVLGDRSAELESRGFDIQVHVREDSPLFFVSNGKVRERLVEIDGVWQSKQQRYSKGELLELLDNHPERFTTSALIRPVLQDRMFPTAAFVTGPSEFNYWVQLKPLYEFFNVEQPLVIPRPSFCIVAAAQERSMRDSQIRYSDLSLSTIEFLSRRMAGSSAEAATTEATTLFSSVRKSIEAEFGRAAASLAKLDPNLVQGAEKTRSSIERNLEKFEGRVTKAWGQRHPELVHLFETVRDYAFPGGVPQERCVGSLDMLLKFGINLPQSLLAEIEPFGVKGTQVIAY